jgi:hypothetical protein
LISKFPEIIFDEQKLKSSIGENNLVHLDLIKENIRAEILGIFPNPSPAIDLSPS